MNKNNTRQESIDQLNLHSVIKTCVGITRLILAIYFIDQNRKTRTKLLVRSNNIHAVPELIIRNCFIAKCEIGILVLPAYQHYVDFCYQIQLRYCKKTVGMIENKPNSTRAVD